LHVHLPTVVVDQRVGKHLDVIQGAEKIEEGVARLGRQDFVPGVRKKPEDERVSFAGAGGEEDLVRVKPGAALGVVLRHRFPRRAQAARVRFIGKRAGMAERRKNLLRVERKAAVRGIGFRQVEDGQAARPPLAQEFGKPIWGQWPVGAG